MKTFKLHIARLLCLVIIFLISSNVAYSVEIYNATSSQEFSNSSNQHHDQGDHFIVNGEFDQLFNLVKDPQEIDFDLFLEECSFVAVIIQGFYFIEKNLFVSYSPPILNHVPLWITNLQIRL